MESSPASLPLREATKKLMPDEENQHPQVAEAWAETLKALSERDRLKEEAEKLKRELAVAKRRFEKEEKLAAERGADIEDLREQVLGLQNAVKGVDERVQSSQSQNKDALAQKETHLHEAMEQLAAFKTSYQRAAAAIGKIHSAVLRGEMGKDDGSCASETILATDEVTVEVQETREASEECVPPDACQLESLADQVCRKAQELHEQLQNQQRMHTEWAEKEREMKLDSEKVRSAAQQKCDEASETVSAAKQEIDGKDKELRHKEALVQEKEAHNVRLEARVRELEQAAAKFSAKEQSADTEAPRGFCNCMA